MKKFIAWVSGMDQMQQELWQEAGFDIIQPERSNIVQDADIIWLYPTNSRNSQMTIDFEDQQKLSYPKVFFLCKRDASVLLSLEEPLPTALLEYFTQQKTADLAAAVYMTLLESVFRETAEWCGHMSSVVGRM